MLANLDLISPCRNRVNHLLHSLPSWINCPQVKQILITDFSSTPALLPQLTGFDLTKVTVIRVEDEVLWRQGRAQNIALAYSQSEFVLKLDSDIELIGIQAYLESLASDQGVFYRGFSKLGSSSGSCLFRRRQGRRCGGWHDHMSGWGGDDVDFYQRLRRRGLKSAVFAPESFCETTQPMEGKNSEAPRIDSQLLLNQPSLARQPLFSGVRNTLLSRLHKQTRKHALRYKFKRDSIEKNLVHAQLRQNSRLELALGQYSTELANILTVHYFHPNVHPREILSNREFKDFRQCYQLDRPGDRQERQKLIQEIPHRLEELRALAKQLGIPTLPLQ